MPFPPPNQPNSNLPTRSTPAQPLPKPLTQPQPQPQPLPKSPLQPQPQTQSPSRAAVSVIKTTQKKKKKKRGLGLPWWLWLFLILLFVGEVKTLMDPGFSIPGLFQQKSSPPTTISSPNSPTEPLTLPATTSLNWTPVISVLPVPPATVAAKLPLVVPTSTAGTPFTPQPTPTDIPTARPTSSPTPTPTYTPVPQLTPSQLMPAVVGVKFLYANGNSPGNYASVGVQTAPSVKCSIFYTTPRGQVVKGEGLLDKVSGTDGQLNWSWPIGSRSITGTGDANVSVSCQGQGSANAIIVIG